jgi:threonine/homoserine efflux transporter RhtA
MFYLKYLVVQVVQVVRAEPVPRDLAVQQEPTGPMEQVVLKDRRDQAAPKVLLAIQELKVIQALKALKDHRDLVGQVGLAMYRALLGPAEQVLRDRKVHRDRRDQAAPKDPKDPVVSVM